MPARLVMLWRPDSRSVWSACSLLPLSKASGARERRPAASHSDPRAFSLSSSGGEGRGEEALLSILGQAPKRCLASAFSGKDELRTLLLAKAFGVRGCRFRMPTAPEAPVYPKCFGVPWRAQRAQSKPQRGAAYQPRANEERAPPWVETPPKNLPFLTVWLCAQPRSLSGLRTKPNS